MVPLNSQPRYYYSPYSPLPNGAGSPPNTKVDSVKIDIVKPQAGGVVNQIPQANVVPLQPLQWYYPSVQLPTQAPPPISNLNIQPQVQQVAHNAPPANDSNTIPASKIAEDRSEKQKPEALRAAGKEPTKEAVQELPRVSPELIKKLDKSLNSTDEQTRVNSASELSLMCEKDPEFAKDPRVTNLLNRMLKDYNPNVRFFALTAFDLGAAQNKETHGLLNKIKDNKDPLGDGHLVNSILLKNTTPKKEVSFEGETEHLKNAEIKNQANQPFSGINPASNKEVTV